MSHVDGVDDGAGYGVYGRSDRTNGRGVDGYGSYIGVTGWTPSGIGVNGYSPSGIGVLASGSLGVDGYSERPKGIGVRATSDNGYGLLGDSWYNIGVFGRSFSGHALWGTSNGGYGVIGLSLSNYGVTGQSDNNYGVYGYSNYTAGVYGYSSSSGINNYTPGVYGHSPSYGVWGDSYSDRGVGVYGYSPRSVGVYGKSDSGFAAVFNGNVKITGNLQKASGSFKIDHPLDPANKYLYHSFVESPDMKNVYDGVAILGENGEAEIGLPDWFGALNRDFRYQLTAIGTPGPNLYVAEEISDVVTKYGSGNNSHFKIAGGTSGMKVSWQVTGIRKDHWANANRIQVEEDKPPKERGHFLYPELYGQLEEKSVSRLLFSEGEKWQEQLVPEMAL